MVSIIIYSSDGYEDCWDPFFKLLKKNFPLDDSYEIILLTNKKKYQYPGLRIRTMANGLNTPWSKRLKIGINRANYDIVFLIGDDFFLLEKVNEDLFNQQLKLIIESSEVDHIRLLHKPNKFKSSPSSFPFLDKIDNKTKYRFLYAPSLWKKQSLLQYIVDFESPFMSEKMGTYRSRILRHGFYCMSDEFKEKNGNMYSCGTSGVIIKGKWAKWVEPVFKKNDLDIDLSIRGVREESEKKGSILRARMNQLMNPSSTFKSYISIFSLYLKALVDGKN